MSIRIYKPTSNGRRRSSVAVTKDLSGARPSRALRVIKKQFAGRASHGKISVRHRGGGEKRFLRVIDGRREKFDMPAKVIGVEYDPNRGARLMLLEYPDGEKAYSIAPEGVVEGASVISSRGPVELVSGNRTTFANIPVGLEVYDIEIQPGKGAQLVRGAGCSAQFRALEDDFALIKLPSGEIRKIFATCMATIGRVSNSEHNLVRYGKAGRTRHRGFRPTVRGKVMNPVDHPHGGGEGKNSIGMPYPKTPWGKHALGVRTRNRNKWSNKFIVKRRYESAR